MNKERDKFLTEAMDECWHEFDPEDRYNGIIYPCKHCKDEYLLEELETANSDLNFSTWEGFGKLWEWAEQQVWWVELFRYYLVPRGWDYVNPDVFANTIYEFLKENK